MYTFVKYVLYNAVTNYIIYNMGNFVVKTILVNTLPSPVTRMLCLTR